MIARLGHVIGWTLYTIAGAGVIFASFCNLIGTMKSDDGIILCAAMSALFLLGRAVLYVLSGE